MRIEFFADKNGGLDERALSGGVYRVDLVSMDETGELIPLYVGEGGCIVKRCGVHLMEFNNAPEYFGLHKKDVDNDALILRFSVVKTLKTKDGRFDKTYIEEENKVKNSIKPITQTESENSDNMLRKEKKIKVVQKALKEKG